MAAYSGHVFCSVPMNISVEYHENILFEASGNINPQNLIGYADCGIDVVSMGCLTNSAKSLDISLEVK